MTDPKKLAKNWEEKRGKNSTFFTHYTYNFLLLASF
ncbi:hypothetical protein Osc7112_6747 (plasmid) [Oscillatoria nigro-viridis PCC 7112]|uniref:Uncharacterized protein n=1 Tax=Phormidium nigroviride PCC 7112 TaxID=179408 RepID=K9VSD0_9CYAN|nr:hypothetical protein Osc7112_6747 [Oscillatoria nigro-viridis PCC 7112]